MDCPPRLGTIPPPGDPAGDGSLPASDSPAPSDGDPPPVDPLPPIGPTQPLNVAPLIAAGASMNLLVAQDSDCGAGPNSFDLEADDPDGDASALTWSVAQSPSIGTVSVQAHVDPRTATVCYTPTAGAYGPDQFDIRVTDADGGDADITIVVNVARTPTALYRINCGGADYTDPSGDLWMTDVGAAFVNTGNPNTVTSPIDGTDLDPLYQSERWDEAASPPMIYSLPVDPGLYLVRLHFAEIFFFINAPDKRLFDVSVEDVPVLDDFDIFSMVGSFQSLVIEFHVQVTDGLLEIAFAHVSGKNNPKVSAIEVWTPDLLNAAPELRVVPESFAFGTVIESVGAQKNLFLLNTGTAPLEIPDIVLGGPDAAAFNFNHAPPYQLPPGNSLTIPGAVPFSTAIGNYTATLTITSNDPNDAGGLRVIPVSALVAPFEALLDVTPDSVDFGDGNPGVTSDPMSITLRNVGTAPLMFTAPLVVTGPDAADFDFPTNTPATLQPGAQTTIQGTFTPGGEGDRQAVLEIRTNDDNDAAGGGVRPVPLAGRGVAIPVVRFDAPRVILDGASPGTQAFSNPTSLTFGPDGRLYVAQQDGRIHILTLDANHDVTAVQVVSAIHDSPTFNDDAAPVNPGSLAAEVSGRQVTGIFVDPASPPSAPVLYAAHADPRIGINNNEAAQQIDTDGGVLTRLTGPDFDNPANRFDLVVGLPRSRENHATNGIQMGTDGWLYLSQGGNTNYGAPSAQFGNLPEVPLSASILRVNPSAITETIDVSAGSQAGATAGAGETPGVFEVFATGYRNGYDLLWHSNGRLYLNVNAGNNGFGNTPGPAEGCADGASLNPGTLPDTLHIVSAGAYGGHPNPARGFCIFGDGAAYEPDKTPHDEYTPPIHLYQNSASTNGLAEYTSLAFGGQMLGDLVTVSTFLGNNLRRVQLGADGTTVQNVEILATGLGGPIDVAVHPDGSLFVAQYAGDNVTVLEPFGGGTAGDNDGDGVPDAGDPDDDNDGYTDDDEIANGTDPLSPGSRPDDFDGDLVSDLSDNDDDDDGVPDADDPFVFDATNGDGTLLPVRFEWNPGDDFLGKLRNTGFTGVQHTSNGAGFLPNLVTVGAAGGFMSIITTAGDAHEALNDQDNALQIGIDASADGCVGPFTVSARLTAPFVSPPVTPDGNESAGIFLGLGEDDYMRLALRHDPVAGMVGIEWTVELDGVVTAALGSSPVAAAIPGSQDIDLFLAVSPLAGTIEALYRIDSDDPADTASLGVVDATTLPGVERFFARGLGLGVTATRRGSTATQFVAVYDYFRIEPGAGGTVADTGARASLVIDTIPRENLLASSTFGADSFTITNDSTGGQKIRQVRLNIGSALLRDFVFDPFGVAGDVDTKQFQIDSDTGVGFVGPIIYAAPHDGGFDELVINTDDFAPGEAMGFSIDVDPTTIRGAVGPGPNGTGHVSGLELVGSRVTFCFDDGTVLRGELYRRPGSVTISEVDLAPNPPAAPSIAVVGVAQTPAAVANAGQTMRVGGPPGASVALLQLEGGLFLDGVANGGFDVDPFEANMALAVAEQVGVIGAGGFVDIPVTLTRSDPNGGYNHFAAVIIGPDGKTGPLSPVIILRYVGP